MTSKVAVAAAAVVSAAAELGGLVVGGHWSATGVVTDYFARQVQLVEV
jgi:hypothetical protein